MMERIAVVFVERPGPEHGIEINNIDAERIQIREPVDYALQITSISAVKNRFIEFVRNLIFPIVAGVPVAGPVGDCPGGRNLTGVFERFAGRIVRRVAVAKTFGENLIDDGLGRPGRHGIRSQPLVERPRFEGALLTSCRDNQHGGQHPGTQVVFFGVVPINSHNRGCLLPQ